MLQLFAITIAVLAWLTSVLTIGFGIYLEGVRAGTQTDIRHMVDVAGGLAGAFLWFLAAFGASSLQVVSSGVVVVEPSDAAAYVFAAFGVLMVVVAFIGTGFLMDVRDLTDAQIR